ncbi:unnamed protein product [Gemmata massiliana]|uniref:Uncharacterized protein n=1 Tax=Gemmata massiliana TaxID=1210884 RepID=A0A6P2D2Q6_9BACT|nr:hypothetical protein [Gemmata massiliana]VTR94675.1 unnamed protein product [Gemmata massiliana]
MRRLSIAAFLAVPLLLLASPDKASANPTHYGFGCGDFCLGLFKGIHQNGPLFNYGPYYGYYPFKPYGPWDEYLRYDPYFYGTPGAGSSHGGWAHGGHLRGLFHKSSCSTCGFWHASWLQGGWFRGHTWTHNSGSLFHSHKPSCSSCGGVAVATPAQPTGDVFARYSGVGSPAQSAVFYSATPTLNPVLDLVPTAGQTK